MKLRLPSSRALLAWLFFAHGFLPIVKCNLISNFQEFAMLNTADTNPGSSDETFPGDAFPPNNAFPPDNAFPPNNAFQPNNNAFPPNNVIAPVNILPQDNLPGKSSFPSDHNQPDPNPSGFNKGLPLDNSPPSDNGKSIGPIMPSKTNDPFINGKMISQGMPLGTPINWSGSQGTPVGRANQPKPTVDPKVDFFLPWIPSGSSFVNLKDGSITLFQPSDKWQSGETLGAANFGINPVPPSPIKPTVSKLSGPISNTMPLNPKPSSPIQIPNPIGPVVQNTLPTSNSMPLNPKPITPIQKPKPIGPVVINTLPTAPETPSQPVKHVINTGINLKPIHTGAVIPLGTVDIISSIPVGTINIGGIPLGTVDIQTGSSSPKGTGSIPKGGVNLGTVVGTRPIVDPSSGVGTIILSGLDLTHGVNDIQIPNGNGLANQWVGDIYDGRPRPVVVEVTEAPIPVSPTCEILGQVTLRNMGRDKKEYAMLRRQCAEERKQAREALKQQRQQLKAQNQLIKAAKQEQKQIQLAVKQEQKAVQQEVRAAKQEQRQITKAAKQEQQDITQDQRAARQEERVSLKAFKQDQKGARPVGVVDLSVGHHGAVVAQMTLPGPDSRPFVGKTGRGRPGRGRRAPNCKGKERKLGLCAPEKVPPGQAKVKGNQKPKGGQGGGKKGGGEKVKDPKVREPKKMTPVELVLEVTTSSIPDMSQIENIPGFGMIDWSG